MVSERGGAELGRQAAEVAGSVLALSSRLRRRSNPALPPLRWLVSSDGLPAAASDTTVTFSLTDPLSEGTVPPCATSAEKEVDPRAAVCCAV